MIKHYIILGSSYKTGKRIAVDFTKIDENFSKFVTSLKKSNAQYDKYYSIAMHTITTETNKWEDVVKTDPFFEKVELINIKSEFIKHLTEDENITAFDVANYIVSKRKCTHTRLEKLLYFCYADYLCKYKDKLFNDNIYAFKYGPVIESIYERYKRQESLIDNNGNEYIDTIPHQYKNPIRSRIMNCRNGIQKIKSIDDTLSKYKYYNTNNLILLTHKDKTPWAINGRGTEPYRKISDEDILKYHQFEEI